MQSCGCCEGVKRVTPRALFNRPGLAALQYRVGSYATFLETMKARLSSASLPGLKQLTARDLHDPALAFLDAWATVADVLTFYQERIANEGYLRTATERRSILELARLVGYSLRPGVAASVYLAYTLDPNSDVVIPAGSRAQSVPGPGELPQAFETADALKASAQWNDLRPRQTQPQVLTDQTGVLYLEGITTALKPNDPLLLVTNPAAFLRRVKEVVAEPLQNRTKVVLQNNVGEPRTIKPQPAFDRLGEIVKALIKPPAQPPPSSARLERSLSDTLTRTAETVPLLTRAFRPEVGPELYTAIENAVVTEPSKASVFALRAIAAPFGHNAPLKPVLDERGVPEGFEEWPLAGGQEYSVLLAMVNDDTIQQVAITVKIGNEVGSAVQSLQGQAAEVTVGPEKVKVSQNDKSIRFEFNVLGRVLTMEAEQGSLESALTKDGAIKIKADDDHPHTLRRGQSAQYSRAGRRVRMQFARRATVAVAVVAPRVPNRHILPLNAIYDQIQPDGWVVIEPSRAEKADKGRLITKVGSTSRVSKTDYGLTAQVTQLTLQDEWLSEADTMLSDVRSMTVMAQSELLELAKMPITDDVCGERIELERLHPGLETGRWLIVSGERTDIPDTSGVDASELVMLAGIEHDTADLPGDTTHSFLTLSPGLAYCYKRDTIRINGNVARATHGETRHEPLGHGDGTRAFQSFMLRQQPLTHVASPTAAGIQSSLEIRVNNIRWHEVASFAPAQPTDRSFVTRTDDDDRTLVTFGNGQRGARLPTGVENVRATYRAGIGKPGNVAAGQITLLTTKPLGVKEVVNPLRASGGADRESRDEGRRNAPLGVMALDRLVATRDYEHFARSFAGIGKARARLLPDAGRRSVHLTIAGADDIPIDATSDLYRHLVEALYRFGDPELPVEVVRRELKLLVLKARVGFHPDYLWEALERQIRAALIARFGFAEQDLGEDVRLSEILAVIHSIEGVRYVDVDVLDAISERLAGNPQELAKRMAEIAAAEQQGRPPSRIRASVSGADRGAAQLLVFSATVPDTLILHGRPS